MVSGTLTTGDQKTVTSHIGWLLPSGLLSDHGPHDSPGTTAIYRATKLRFGYPSGGWEDTICKPPVKGANIRRHALCSIDWIPTQRARGSFVQGIYLRHLLVG